LVGAFGHVARKLPPSSVKSLDEPFGGCNRQIFDGHSSAGELTLRRQNRLAAGIDAWAGRLRVTSEQRNAEEPRPERRPRRHAHGQIVTHRRQCGPLRQSRVGLCSPTEARSPIRAESVENL
jgi:hypothetical protein